MLSQVPCARTTTRRATTSSSPPDADADLWQIDLRTTNAGAHTEQRVRHLVAGTARERRRADFVSAASSNRS